MTRKRIYLLILLALLLIPTGSALAGTLTDRVVEEDSVAEDVTVLGDDLTVEDGGRIRGDAVVVNGDASIAGTVSGSLVVINGDLEIEETGVISGDCVLIGGELTDRGQTATSCTTVSRLPAFVGPLLEQVPNDANFDETMGDSTAPDRVPESGFGRTAGTISSAVGSALVVGILAFIVGSVAPAQLRRVNYAVTDNPVAAGGIGFLTMIAVPALLILLTIISAVLLIVIIGLLGIPIILLVLAAFGIALLMGWAAIGHVVGEQLSIWLHLAKNRSFATTTALGTAALSLILGVLPLVPLGEFGSNVASFLIAIVGLGAVVLTKFGTRQYPAYRTDPTKVAEAVDNMPVGD